MAVVSSHMVAREPRSPQAGMSFSRVFSSFTFAHSWPGQAIIGRASIESPPKPYPVAPVSGSMTICPGFRSMFVSKMFICLLMFTSIGLCDTTQWP